jgi:hypothetical protein
MRPPELLNPPPDGGRFPLWPSLPHQDALRRLALEEKMRDGKGSMSEMVREAIDAYLAKRKASTE